MRRSVFAILVLALVMSTVAEDNYEERYSDQFISEDIADEINPLGANMTPETQFYAGPLRPTEEDEVIVVSRDNVQQIIKTVMLAYTHSKDPTMMQLFKSGGLGALKTTFKYLGKEDLGDAILTTAQKYIKELNLETEEEALLGEFAEEFLEKHKFKVVVPESFLLHEKEMVEYLEKKKKVPQKKGAVNGWF